MVIENAFLDYCFNRATSLAHGRVRPPARSSTRTYIDQLALFLRANAGYELVRSGSGSAGRPSIAAHTLERVLALHPGAVPIEWRDGAGFIMGERLGPEESRFLADLGTEYVLGISGNGRVDGFVCVGGTKADTAGGDPSCEGREWEFEFAKEVQRRLFPAEQPHVQGLDHYGDWRPAEGLSGDYLDYLETPGGEFCLTIGDVAGKGVAAAFVTSCLHSMARALHASSGCGPADIVAAMDEVLYRICPDHTYATLFAARFDPGSGAFDYVNAGHEPPVVLRKTPAGQRVVVLERTGPVIGMLRKPVFRERRIMLAPGDVVAAYTDGLCGITNARGEEWGFRRVVEAIQTLSYGRARDIVERVLEKAEAFAGGSVQYDDATLWVGRVVSVASLMVTMAHQPIPAVA